MSQVWVVSDKDVARVFDHMGFAHVEPLSFQSGPRVHVFVRNGFVFSVEEARPGIIRLANLLADAEARGFAGELARGFFSFPWEIEDEDVP